VSLAYLCVLSVRHGLDTLRLCPPFWLVPKDQGLLQGQFLVREEYRGLPELSARSVALAKTSKYTKWVIGKKKKKGEAKF